MDLSKEQLDADVLRRACIVGKKKMETTIDKIVQEEIRLENIRCENWIRDNDAKIMDPEYIKNNERISKLFGFK